MKSCRLVTSLVLLIWMGVSPGGSVEASELGQRREHKGMCDASAGASLGENLFVVVNDEDNALRVFDATQDGLPRHVFDAEKTEKFLKLERKGQEADIEGAARIGDRVYWITSHGNNRKGRPRPNRYRLFATRFQQSGSQFDLSFEGKPYRDLRRDMLTSLEKSDPELSRAIAARLYKAPEDGGLNIEGLAATAEGGLFIGLRSPTVHGHAVVVPLTNPAAVVDDKDPPGFGKPILLNLGGRGIRSIEYSDSDGSYLIIAGPVADKKSFQLWRWSMKDDRFSLTKLQELDFGKVSPEALIIQPSGKEGLLLLDEGDRPVGNKPCKEADENKRSFHSVRVVGL